MGAEINPDLWLKEPRAANAIPHGGMKAPSALQIEIAR
jgi:hypothetical protein